MKIVSFFLFSYDTASPLFWKPDPRRPTDLRPYISYIRGKGLRRLPNLQVKQVFRNEERKPHFWIGGMGFAPRLRETFICKGGGWLSKSSEMKSETLISG